MRRVFCIVVVALILAHFSVGAQAAEINVYFDAGLSVTSKDCPGPGLDTLYVAAENFGAFVVGFEFKVDLPASLIWLSDIGTPPVTLGTTVTGISTGYGIPQNGFFPLVIAQMIVLWNCTDCSSFNDPITVSANPSTNYLGGVRWPDYVALPATGGTSVVCERTDMDIKPTSCPNPFNVQNFDWTAGAMPRKGGIMPVAILGSPALDVNDIDVSSLLLEGVSPLPRGTAIDDVSRPAWGGECACTVDGPDGFDDLVLKFSNQEIAASLGVGSVGETKVLTLTGVLLDGTPIQATDCILIVGKKLELPTPKGLSEPVLGPAAPNPFNPVTRLTFVLPTSEHVKLAVYDVAGRMLEVLAEGTYPAGEHIVEWDATGLASGVYYYRLVAGGKVQVRRATLLK